MDLFVVYGSETSVLSELYDRPDSKFLCIYNRRVPASSPNKVLFNSVSKFVDEFKQMDCREFKRIVFVGAAAKITNALFVNQDLEQIAQLIETNVENYLKLANAILPTMLEVGCGRFIFLSSFRSSATCAGTSVYSASKAFGEKFFETIGKEYGSLGVTANNIRLGCFDGEMFRNLDKKIQTEFMRKIGNRRLGKRPI